MSLESIVKTSGKTGLHVFVPIRRTLDFDAARQVSELVGRHLMRQHPKDITMEWSVPKRTGKIFMDYNMNVRGKTLNVAYSPRGVPGRAGVDAADAGKSWQTRTRSTSGSRTSRSAWRETGDRWRDAWPASRALEARAGARAKA